MWTASPIIMLTAANQSNNQEKKQLTLYVFHFHNGSPVALTAENVASCRLSFLTADLTDLHELTRANTVLHPPGVANSSTSFGWAKSGNVSSVGWQVTLRDPIWNVSSVAMRLVANCYNHH